MEERADVKTSMAFKEYVEGRNKKIKPPWVIITISGILVALAVVATNELGEFLYGNPYAYNFILALYGIPAGFACAWKNTTFSVLVSFRYSTFSAIISAAAYFIISFITVCVETSISGVGLLSAFLALLLACGLILLYYICFSFSLGAFFGTFIHGVVDSRKK